MLFPLQVTCHIIMSQGVGNQSSAFATANGKTTLKNHEVLLFCVVLFFGGGVVFPLHHILGS